MTAPPWLTPHQAAVELARRKLAREAEATKKYSPHSPTPKQSAFVDYDGLEALYGGAAGGGKSDALLMAALKFVHVPGYAALLLRQSYTDLALPGAIMDRSHQWLQGSDAHWDGLNKSWRFPAGSVLSFGYLEGPRDHFRYQSAEFQFVGFDELTQFLEAQYTYLFSRLRSAGVSAPLRMRAATNPGGVGHDWVMKRWHIPELVDFDRVYETSERRFYPARKEDNPHLDLEGYERSLAQLEFAVREQLSKGSWRQDKAGLVYKFDPDRDCVTELPKLPPRMQWSNILGIDYGTVNATAFVVLRYCLDFSDVVYVAESEKWTDLEPSKAAEFVDAWSKRYGGFVSMVGDVGGLGKGYAQEAVVRWALPIEPAEKQNKYGYVKLINGAYETGKLKVVRAANEALISELKVHPWKSGKVGIEEQPGSANHACDAHLYGWRAAIAWAHKAAPSPPPPPGSTEFYAREEARMRDEAQRDADRDPFEMDPFALDS